MNQLTPGEAHNLLTKWRNKPETYLSNVLGIEKIWRLQSEVLAACPVALKEGKHIYIASGHSLGKDYICAAISLWFLHCYSPSKVIQTAPTDRQVRKIMWGETSGHWNKRVIDLGGKASSSPYLEIRKNDWFLIGFTTKETGASSDASGGKFQGFHSQNMCVIVSEAQAVEDNIYDQIDAVTTSDNSLVIFIGNPTRAKGRFAKGLANKKDNIVFNFSCLENPNYIQRKEVVPGLASYKWVEDKRKKWGEDDPRWQGRVLGVVPDAALSRVLTFKDIEHMKSRHGLLAMHSVNSGVALDPAGEGVDDNVFMSGKGGEVKDVFTKTNMPPSDQAHQAVKMCKDINGRFIIVDCDGVGIGAYQELMKFDDYYLRGIQIIKFHGSAPSEVEEVGRKVYQNMRSEAAFVTQKRARAGKAGINYLDEELIEDLTEEEYFTNKRGLIQIEDKRDIKERLGRSPGRGDAYKMLQWAFEQEYKDEVYKSEDSRLPQEQVTDELIVV